METVEGSSEPAQRIVSIDDAMERMSKMTDPEEIQAFAQEMEEAKAAVSEYGFADKDTMHKGHIPNKLIDQVNDRGAFAADGPVTGGSIPDVNKGAVQIDTYEIVAKEGSLRHQPEQSGPRWCLAGQYLQATGRDMRPIRLRIILPPGGGLTSEMRHLAEGLGSPQRELAQCIPKAPPSIDDERGSELETYQRTQIKKMAMAFARHGPDAAPLRNHIQKKMGEVPLEDVDRVPVKSEPEVRAAPIGEEGSFSEWKVTFMDAEEVLRFTDNAGDWHYLGGLVSDGGSVPGENKPDYRRWPYMAVTPKELSPLMELLGLGPAYDFEEDRPIVDGQGPVLFPEWPGRDYEAMQFQLRAITDFGPDQKPTYSKGMGQPVRPQALTQALEMYEGLSSEEQEYFQGAAKILRTALSRSEPTLILVRDDQMKIGHGQATTSGMALVTSTYLRGTTDADPSGRPYAPYRIIGNAELTQLLKTDAFERLKDHLHEEKNLIVEKTRSLPGLAQIAGETTARREEEIRKGNAAYVTHKDMLSDAVTGGGFRMTNSEEWTREMMGENGEMCTLKSISSRLQSAGAAFVKRRLLRGLGIVGWGHHHMTCANDQWLLRHLWPTEGGEPHLQKAREETLEADATPICDPSSAVHPEPVAGLMGADDDGDIVTGIAAEMTVPTPEGETEATVLMHWRYPAVDVPVFWALPKRFQTPWDPRSEEEAERNRRIIKVFAPEMRAEDPTGSKTAGLEDRKITLLHASGAIRLAGEGARGEIDDTSISKDASEGAGWEMVDRKRQLNQAGRLTRDLERLGEITAEAERHVRRGEGHQKRYAQGLFDDVRAEAAEVKTFTELVLIKHKKETRREIREPRVTWPDLGYTDPKEVRQVQLPLDYHQQIDEIQSMDDLKAYADGTRQIKAADRHGAAIAELFEDGAITEIVEALDLSIDRAPFLRALNKKARDYIDSAEDPEEAQDTLDNERVAVRQVCQWYRSVWSEVMDEVDQIRQSATDPEAAEDKAQELLTNTRQALSRAMSVFSRIFSPEGLAWGVYHDWSVPGRGNDGSKNWANSTSAGMRLITGRMGEVFLPPEVDVEQMQPDERFAVVYSTRDLPELPIPTVGGTRRADSIRFVETEDGRLAVHLRFEEDEATLYFDSKSEAPPKGLEEAVEAGEAEARLSRIAPRRGVLRWLIPQD